MTRVNLHSKIEGSRANGPGNRYVVWFRGCSLGCPGCFNPSTHSPIGGDSVDTSAIARAVLDGDYDGLTISGGEPFEQPQALLALVKEVFPQKGIIVFSGYSESEIIEQELGSEILRFVDVLIDGRYERAEKIATELRGSSNQEIRLYTDRYVREDITATPELEIRIGSDGLVTVSGVQPIPLGRIRQTQEKP